MKEQNFNLTESIDEVLKNLDEKRAGRLIKAVGDYYFKRQSYIGKDTMVKTNFILIKSFIDAKTPERTSYFI